MLFLTYKKVTWLTTLWSSGNRRGIFLLNLIAEKYKEIYLCCNKFLVDYYKKQGWKIDINDEYDTTFDLYVMIKS